MSHNLTVEEWYPHVLAALRDWREATGVEANPLFQWQLVRQKLTVIHDERPEMRRLVLNEVIREQLNTLSRQDAQLAGLLTSRFLENEGVWAMADAMHMDKDSYLRRQRKAVQELTAVMIRAEEQARELRARQIESGLYPPTYYQLMGVEDTLEEVIRLLLAPDGAQVLALVGLGGIGKTALADAAVRRIIRRFHFDQTFWLRVGGTTTHSGWPAHDERTPADLTSDGLLAWLAARVAPQMPVALSPGQRNAQLRNLLKSNASLIVIDNLELPDSEADWASVLPALASPTRFLLTSRTRITDQAGIYHLPVRELSPVHAGELIRGYGEHLGVPSMALAGEEQVRQIYDVAGGNPLALKLVVSLAAVRPLRDIIADLQRAYTPRTESLYQGIYWQAWQTLSPPARALLEVMPLAGDTGMAPAQMQRLSNLEDAAFWAAIDELVHRSLLEVVSTMGDVHARRYSIHRLTETFLHTSISGWSRQRL